MARLSIAGGVPMAAAAAVMMLLARPAAQAPAQSDRSVVSVNVSVRSGTSAVVGLTANDFRVTDNGQRQVVQAVPMETVPVDLTLVVDMGSSTPAAIRRFLTDADSLIALLRPTDRVRVLAIDSQVHELVPLQTAGRIAWPARLPSSGASAVHDALVASLVMPVDAGRRHLIVALTDVVDTISALDATAVREAAERSNAVLHIVSVTFDRVPPPVPPIWLPRRDSETDVLREAAGRTGGDFFLGGQLGPAAIRIASMVIDEFRTGYLLRFTPTTSTPGWHTLDVRVTRRESWAIRARSGYFR